MTTTLSEGVKVPDVGSVNWAGDLEVNWNLLNGALANLSGNVKTDRDNTWTGEQSFTLPIVGSITGTASKAIADEDGTSIKTGYVNVAGNQTVSGQKDWSNLQTFSYGQIRIKSLSQEIGVTPSTSIIQYLEFADKNNVQHGKVGLWDYDNGASEIQMSISDKYKNGAKDSTGTSDTAFLSFGFQYNGTKFLTFSGQVNNSIIPLATNTYALGSSSYQWSAVYAQSYYYNGTAWGLDKANTWTGNNTFTSTITTKTNVDRTVAPSSDTTYGTIICRDKNNSAMFRMQGTIKTDLSNVWYMMMVAPNASYITFFKYTLSSSSSDRELRFKVTSVVPDDNSTADLGTSTNKWKTLNGVNPGALSLPDASKSVTVDTTNYTWTGSDNTYVAPADGWLSLKTTTGLSGRLEGTTTGIGSIVERSAGGRLVLLHIPVLKNESVTVSGNGSDFILKFFPCLGNV